MRRLLGLAALLAVSGCASVEAKPVQETPTPGTTAVKPRTPTPSQTGSSLEVRPDDPSPPTTPTHLRMGDIAAPVVPLPMTGTSLVPPDDPKVLGWWGRPAAATRGTTLLVGHTVHDGGGELDHLEHVRVGQVAHVSGVRYVVTTVRVVSKARLARNAARTFDQDGPHRLVVVTCEDYDPATGHYASNVVLIATRHPSAAAPRVVPPSLGAALQLRKEGNGHG